MKRRKIGLTIEECVKRADRFIGMNGYCYLAMDVIGSTKMDIDYFYSEIRSMVKGINEKFSDNFVGRWDTIGTRGPFEVCRGDSAGTYVNSVEVVKNIIEYCNREHSSFPSRWVVGKEANSWAIKQL